MSEAGSMRARREDENPPLRTWSVHNFKSIPDAELKLAPLTVLVGANSSGKSSVIQSILLFVQAAQGSSEGSTFPLNGPLVSLGGYEDVRFRLAKDQAVRMGGTFDLGPEPLEPQWRPRPGEMYAPLRQFRRATPPVQPATMVWALSVDGPPVEEPGSAQISAVDVHMTAPEELGVGLGPELHIVANRRGQGETAVDTERLRIGKLVWPTREDFALGFSGRLSGADSGELDVHGLALRAGIPHNVLTRWNLEDVAARVWVESRMWRPYWTGTHGPGPRDRPAREGQEPLSDEESNLISVWARRAAKEITAWNDERSSKSVTLPAYLARLRPHLPLEERERLRANANALVDEVRAHLRLEEPVFLPPDIGLATPVHDTMSELHRFFRERVVYLGPLRADPQVSYRSTPIGAPGFIGTKGEFMAAVMHASRARQVLCPKKDGSLEPMRLADALNYWAFELGIADSVTTKDLGRLGIQVSVDRGRIRDLDMTSVGVGVSQLLPVIAMCLLAPPRSLILLEQPELHLHPALQQKLGDFLLACARSGRQCLVETHSEYVVSRLRLRIAEDPSGELISTVGVIFAEHREDASSFRAIELNELGGIEEWPDGFFDQSADESKRILEAGLEKRLRPARTGDAASE